MKLYGLFLCTYDHHEFKDLCYVSRDMPKLKACVVGTGLEIATDAQTHYNLKDDEIAHYVIEKVESLD